MTKQLMQPYYVLLPQWLCMCVHFPVSGELSGVQLLRLAGLTTDLVGTADEIHVVLVQELGDHVCAEGEGDAAVVLAPARHVLVGVGPQQVAQEPLVGHVCGAHHAPNLLHGLQVWRQA